eukprot:m.63705 g.63705  ORF g.63705 m.63705 type:complete len:224 (-) comp9675_c0_seq1:2258-2929(-)
MMSCVALSVAFVSVLMANVSSAAPSTLVIEYSLDGAAFTKRGEVTLKSSGGNSATISQPFEAAHATSLYEVAEKGGNYILRVRRQGDPEDLAVQSFVSACSYYQSGMSDSITLYLDENDRPQSVQVSSTGKCKATMKKKKITKFRSNFAIKRGDKGPQPFVEEYVAKMEERQNGEGEEQKGFFQKYWMYLVPVYLFILLSQAGGGEDGGGGGGGPNTGGGGGK